MLCAHDRAMGGGVGASLARLARHPSCGASDHIWRSSGGPQRWRAREDGRSKFSTAPTYTRSLGWAYLLKVMVTLIEPQTERLLLRQWRKQDREPFAALNSDPHVMEFFPAPLERSASDALANRIERSIAERGWGLWAAELMGSREFIGFVGLEVPSSALPYSPCVEVGWRLAHRYWGQGLATEAARAALCVGFGSVGLSEIFSFTSILNVRSRAVMERLGMVAEPNTFEHPNVPVGDRLREHFAYRLTRSAWNTSAAQHDEREAADQTPPSGGSAFVSQPSGIDLGVRRQG
jgi:RimJ/RimL family protein N-acetyltransferase